MRCKFGANGEDEEDDDEIEKREMEENERRAKHSIDGILGDRCESGLITAPPPHPCCHYWGVYGQILGCY